MYVMVTATYPLHKYPEVTELFKKGMEDPSLPLSVKLLNIFARADKDCGMKSYSIYEVDNEKFSEGYITIARSREPFWNVEGFKYSVEIVTDAVSYVQQRG